MTRQDIQIRRGRLTVFLSKGMRIALLAAVAAAVPLAAIAKKPQGVRVLDRARLGNYVEDITYISAGPHARSIAGITAFGVWAVKTSGSSGSLQKLFDFRDIPLASSPRGLAFMEPEKLFALAPLEPLDHLVLVDNRGRLRENLAIHYLGGFVPGHAEGLAYIPAHSPVFPGHFVIGVWESLNNCSSRLEVIRRDGQVVAEIFPPEPVRSGCIGGVSFKEPNLLVVGNNADVESDLRVLDFNGAFVGEPVPRPGNSFTEGIVQLEDGRVAVTNILSGISMYDAAFNRLPQDDKSFELGLGLSNPLGLAWNPGTQEHLVNVSSDARDQQLVAVPPSLDSSRFILDFRASGRPFPRGMSYIPAESRTVVAHVGAAYRGIVSYDENGVEVEVVGLSTGEQPFKVEYVPETNEYFVRVNSDMTQVKVFSRAGALLRQFDPRPSGVGSLGSFAFFLEDGNPRLLFLMSQRRAVVTDLDGVSLREFNWFDGLGLLAPAEVAAITSGPQAGAFSVVDGETGEIVIFRLN